MEPTRSAKSGWTLGIILGLVIGFCFSCGLGGVGVYVLERREHKRVRAGWNLIPVIIANQDISAGSTVSFDVVSQRPIPEQFVTSSVVKPDSASYVIGQKILVPLQAGDPLMWFMFEDTEKGQKQPAQNRGSLGNYPNKE